jgi:NAD(P)-dependent dehydrogenase (short-subunit alcohol dehydrogenase family)
MKSKRVILVTGASSGIGLATSLKLIEDGHTVYGGARRMAALGPIVDAGGQALSLDVTDEATMRAAVEEMLKREARIDVLINNAGYGSYGAVEDVPMEEARRQVEVNLFGLAGMTRLVLPHMRAQASGAIINISSMGGTIYFPLGAWYHATKHAVEAFSDCLRLEVKRFGIDVVIIAPGAIDTGFNAIVRDQVLAASGDGNYAEMAKGMAAAVVPGRGSNPKVIADVIARAVAANRPRTRYRAGQYSRSLVWLRRLLPDRAFDRVAVAIVA